MDSKKYYLKGQYYDAAESKSDVKTICYKIGGLVFTGQHQEARLLFADHEKKLEIESRVIAQFHLGISYTRTSDYRSARKYFGNNLTLLRSENLSPVASFYAYQGISFYRFFFSQHKRSQRYGEKGYACLLKNKTTPDLLMALSLDIQGHNLIQLGRIHLGISYLKKALKIAESKNLKNLQSEIAIALVIYESEFDENVESQIIRLSDVLKKTDNKNDYSCSELVLQIAKLCILKGDFSKANEFLTNHFDVVYKNENKRKIAKLNTLLAQLLYHKGQFLEALSVTKIAQKNLNKDIDFSLILPIIGIEIKILIQMKKDFKSQLKLSEELNKKIDRYINKRIQNRISKVTVTDNLGEDRLGDLMDKITNQDETVLNLIVKNKLLGMIPSFYDLTPGRDTIIVNLHKKIIFTVTKDSIEVKKSNLTKHQIEVLLNISHNGATKEQLVKKVWGYEYDPLRHDSLIYSAITRLRKVLGSNHWIASDEMSYRIPCDLKIDSPQKQTSKIEEDKIEEPMLLYSNLNFRQIEMLKKSKAKPISVSEYAHQWEVTRMTALRDLKSLCEEGRARTTGRGKATRYYLIKI